MVCCRKRLNGRKCRHPSRFYGFCTHHFIKSGFYKGKNKNLRRRKFKRRK